MLAGESKARPAPLPESSMYIGIGRIIDVKKAKHPFTDIDLANTTFDIRIKILQNISGNINRRFIKTQYIANSAVYIKQMLVVLTILPNKGNLVNEISPLWGFGCFKDETAKYIENIDGVDRGKLSSASLPKGESCFSFSDVLKI